MQKLYSQLIKWKKKQVNIYIKKKFFRIILMLIKVEKQIVTFRYSRNIKPA